MSRFTMENTERYTQGQLDELNHRYDAALEAWDSSLSPDQRFANDDLCSNFDHIAERVQADYDTEISAPGGLDFDPIREFISAVWSDCRLPGDMRRDLEALYHNGVLPVLRKS